MTTWTRRRRLTVAGQAEIWLVENKSSGEKAVMKVLLKTSQLSEADSEAELRRFMREIRSQMALEHPGIMPIIGFNRSADPPFYVMPQADTTLQEVVDDHPTGLDATQAARILIEVCNAVEYAHQQGVIHRDLKPANILQLEDRWVVGDFGLCRDLSSNSTTFTQTNTIVGTVAYMAPEQFDDGHEATPASDVFGLTRVFYHLLIGRVPFPYAPIDLVPPEYRYLISKGMAQEPTERYATVTEFAQQIELIAGRSDVLSSATDRGTGLLTSALGGDDDATESLLELAVANADDEVFYTEFVSRLSEPILAGFQESNTQAFAHVVRTFDEYSQGGHPFNYVDVIADFFARVFRIAEDPMLRHLALKRIMIVGEDHNRFYVGNVFARLVTGLRDPHDILLAVNVMRADRSAARWYKTYLRAERSLPEGINRVLDETA